MHALAYPTGSDCIAHLMNGAAVEAITLDGEALDLGVPLVPDTTYTLDLADGSRCYRTGRQLAAWYHDVTGAVENCCSYVDPDTQVRCSSPATFDLDCEPGVPLDGKVRSCDAHLVAMLTECKKAVVAIQPTA